MPFVGTSLKEKSCVDQMPFVGTTSKGGFLHDGPHAGRKPCVGKKHSSDGPLVGRKPCVGKRHSVGEPRDSQAIVASEGVSAVHSELRIGANVAYSSLAIEQDTSPPMEKGNVLLKATVQISVAEGLRPDDYIAQRGDRATPS